MDNIIEVVDNTVVMVPWLRYGNLCCRSRVTNRLNGHDLDQMHGAKSPYIRHPSQRLVPMILEVVCYTVPSNSSNKQGWY